MGLYAVAMGIPQEHVFAETKAEQYTTDKNGLFKLKKTKEYRTIQLQITNGSDELFMDENNNGYYDYNSYEQPKEITQTFLFTDRSIYRPGQTVYFKGIVIKKANKAAESKVIPAFNSLTFCPLASFNCMVELKAGITLLSAALFAFLITMPLK